jgi:hypothetical protein
MPETMTKLRQNSDSQEAQEHSEGKVARTIEEQTAKVPSDVWLWAAFAAISVSMLFHGTGKREDGLFVGQWVAPFLLFGVYNKLVKVAGYDRTS